VLPHIPRGMCQHVESVFILLNYRLHFLCAWHAFTSMNKDMIYQLRTTISDIFIIWIVIVLLIPLVGSKSKNSHLTNFTKKSTPSTLVRRAQFKKCMFPFSRRLRPSYIFFNRVYIFFWFLPHNNTQMHFTMGCSKTAPPYDGFILQKSWRN
jgi:hypothetical protein